MASGSTQVKAVAKATLGANSTVANPAARASGERTPNSASVARSVNAATTTNNAATTSPARYLTVASSNSQLRGASTAPMATEYAGSLCMWIRGDVPLRYWLMAQLPPSSPRILGVVAAEITHARVATNAPSAVSVMNCGSDSDGRVGAAVLVDVAVEVMCEC